MRKGQHFARAFKRAVAVEYLQSGEERKAIAMKYGLPWYPHGCQSFVFLPKCCCYFGISITILQPS